MARRIGPPARRRAHLVARAACLAAIVAACGAPGASRDPTFGSPIQGTAQPPTAAPPASAGAQASAAASPAPGASAPTGAWARLEVDGAAPSAREDHTWTVDPEAGVAYLFGGRDGGTVFEDLWSFDLASDAWTRLQPGGPAPAARFGHEAAWLPGHGLVVTLGQAGSTFFADVWLFDPTTGAWRELPGDGAAPVPRYGSCSGIGPDGRLWISHGFTEEGSRFFDTRAYDVDAQAWSDETPAAGHPVERCLHTCWWSDSGQLVLYGGQTTGVAALGDLWALRPGGTAGANTWTHAPDPDAAARHLPAIARHGQATIVFGGRDVDRKPLGDTWLVPDPGEGGFSGGATSPFVRLKLDGPPPRSGGALVDDPGRNRLLLFGGIGDAALDDLWVLSFD